MMPEKHRGAPQLGTVDEHPPELIGRVMVEHGARISRSRIVGPAVIGAGTRVDGSYVGPFTSIAEDCTIVDSEIEYSIVLRGRLRQRGTGGSRHRIIGHDVEATLALHAPWAHRLVLGDHSKVQISS